MYSGKKKKILHEMISLVYYAFFFKNMNSHFSEHDCELRVDFLMDDIFYLFFCFVFTFS